MCSRGRWDAIAWSSQVPIPPIVFIALHRWLGLVWPADLQFRLVLAPHPTQEKTRHEAQGPLSDIDIQIDGRTFRLITGAKMFGPLWCPCVT